ncbi:RPN1 (predicted), partial [Pycnogonum litorale]
LVNLGEEHTYEVDSRLRGYFNFSCIKSIDIGPCFDMNFSISLVIISYLICCSLCSANQDVVNQDIVIKKVEREISLVSQLVKIHSKITVENKGKSSVKSFLYAVEQDIASRLAWITATGTNDKRKLNVAEAKVAKYGQDTFWKITLGTPLEPGKTSIINVELIFTHLQTAFPSHITQSEKQFVLYHGNHYLYTPYKVLSQTTTFKLPTSKVESYTKSIKPVSLSDTTLTYGPYENVEPMTVEKLKIHNENNNQFLSVTKLERIIEISHWGNIAVEETIHVRHDGAVLKGSFSRYEYQTEHSGVSAIKGYKTVLPAAASDVYYRDEIGNISTSHLRVLDDSVELELRPRFPLFGGWKTQYKIGYNIPSYEYLFNSGDQFGLKMRFVDHIYDDHVIDDATVKIILPEGCKNIKLSVPYPVKRDKDELHYTYLDTTGRPVIIVHKSDLVESHIQDFEVLYNFNKILMLQEPLLVVVALYLLFLIIIIYVRLDFTISQDDAAESKLKVTGYCSQAVAHQEKRESNYQQYNNALNKYKVSKDNNALQNMLKKLNGDHKVETQAITDLVSKMKAESSDSTDKVGELQKLDKSMKEQLTLQVSLTERLVGGKVNKNQFIESENAIIKRKDEILDKMESIVTSL